MPYHPIPPSHFPVPTLEKKKHLRVPPSPPPIPPHSHHKPQPRTSLIHPQPTGPPVPPRPWPLPPTSSGVLTLTEPIGLPPTRTTSTAITIIFTFPIEYLSSTLAPLPPSSVSFISSLSPFLPSKRGGESGARPSFYLLPTSSTPPLYVNVTDLSGSGRTQRCLSTVSRGGSRARV